MSVKIRLARGGRKKAPFYHVVAADARKSRDGRYIEKLGFYNPVARSGEEVLRLNEDRISHWVSVGAEVTDAVAKLFVGAEMGPKAVREDFTARKNRRTAMKKKEAEAKAAADAAAKAAEEAAAASEEASE